MAASSVPGLQVSNGLPYLMSASGGFSSSFVSYKQMMQALD
jgi:hypothetical protein